MASKIEVKEAQPKIQVLSHSVPAPSPFLPGLIFQVSLLDQSCMVWAGTASNAGPKLASNWTCAMPPVTVRGLDYHYFQVDLIMSDDQSTSAPSSTALYHSSQADYGQSLASLLSKRFNQQIFLSLDLGPALGMDESEVLLHLEKNLTAFLKRSLAKDANA